MTDLVRVKLDDGGEVTVGRPYAEIYKLAVLDKPAVDARGTALEGKPLRSPEEAAEAADTRTPAQKAAATRAEKKAQAEALAAAQAEADAANAAAADQTSSPTGDADSTEEKR